MMRLMLPNLTVQADGISTGDLPDHLRRLSDLANNSLRVITEFDSYYSNNTSSSRMFLFSLFTIFFLTFNIFVKEKFPFFSNITMKKARIEAKRGQKSPKRKTRGARCSKTSFRRFHRSSSRCY